MQFGATWLLVSTILGVLHGSLQAQTTVVQPDVPFEAPDGAPDDYFGRELAAGGLVLVVGAYQHDLGPTTQDAGACYVWRRAGETWSYEAKLSATAPQAESYLGYSVAASGNWIVAGAHGQDTPLPNAGAAQVYWFDGAAWTNVQTLIAADGETDDHFGRAVAISQDWAVVTSTAHDIVGATYLYENESGTWAMRQQVAPSDVSTPIGYGVDVAIAGEVCVVGAGSVGAAQLSGSAYVYRLVDGTWLEEAKLAAPDGHPGDIFGRGVATDGSRIVVGAEKSNQAGINAAGAAYVFVHDGITWVLEQTLVASDLEQSASYGISVAVSGERIAVGAYRDGTDNQGAAYTYRYDGAAWNEESKLTAAASGWLGYAVALEPKYAICGVYRDDTMAGQDAGRAYGYAFPIPTWVNLGNALAGGSGTPSLDAAGELLAGTPVSLSVANALPFAPCVLIVGATAVNEPFKGGVLVPDVDLLVFAAADGFGELDFAGPWPSGVPAGLKLYLQFWVTDPAGPQGYSATNAMRGTAP